METGIASKDSPGPLPQREQKRPFPAVKRCLGPLPLTGEEIVRLRGQSPEHDIEIRDGHVHFATGGGAEP